MIERVRIVQVCAQGLTITAMAERLDASPSAVRTWRRRFLERGVEDLRDDLRPGWSRTHDDEKAPEFISRTLQKKRDNASAWSVRLMAEAKGRLEEHSATLALPEEDREAMGVAAHPVSPDDGICHEVRLPDKADD